MPSVMQQMRLARTDIHRAFERRLPISRAHAGPVHDLTFVCGMWGWLAPFEGPLKSFDWPVELMPSARDGTREWLTCGIDSGFGTGTAPEIARSSYMPPMDTLDGWFEKVGMA